MASTRALPILLISLAAIVALAMAVQAETEPGFGSVVGEVDDIEHVIDSDGPDTFHFRDSGGNDRLNSGEPVFLTSGTTTESGDVRLANPWQGDEFTKIQSGDADDGIDLTPLEGELRFFDDDGDGIFTPGDTLYYDLARTTDERASIGDLILTGPNAGTLVSTDHDKLNFGLTTFDDAPDFGFYDENDDSDLNQDEAIILNLDTDGYITAGDIRFGETPGGPGGTVVEHGDVDATPILHDFSDDWVFQHRGDENDFRRSDPVYINNGDTVTRFAVRIANSDEPIGRQVTDFSDDHGIATYEIGGSFGFIDADGSGDVTSGDTLYFDTDDTTDGEVRSGDIILSGSNAGNVAGGGTATGDIGQTLESYTGTLRFLDTRGTGAYDSGDIIYADTDNDEIVNEGAVQLSDGVNPYDPEPADPPTITITAPETDATLTQNESVTIEGTAGQGDAPLDTIDLTAGEEELTVTGLESWNASWTPTTSGEHTIEATVTDDDGETDTATITVNIEAAQNQPPTIEITTPTEDTDANMDATLTIEGNATAGDGELTEVTVQAGDETLTVDGLEHWSAEWTPTEPGVDVITATVTDANDNTDEATVTVTVTDNEPPTVTITDPEDGTEVTQGEPITIEGTATPGTEEISLITITVGGETLEAEGTETWQTEWTPSGSGADVITATVTDQAGLTGSDSVTVSVTTAQTPGPSVILVLGSLLAGLALAGRRRC